MDRVVTLMTFEGDEARNVVLDKQQDRRGAAEGRGGYRRPQPQNFVTIGKASLYLNLYASTGRLSVMPLWFELYGRTRRLARKDFDPLAPGETSSKPFGVILP